MAPGSLLTSCWQYASCAPSSDLTSPKRISYFPTSFRNILLFSHSIYVFAHILRSLSVRLWIVGDSANEVIRERFLMWIECIWWLRRRLRLLSIRHKLNLRCAHRSPTVRVLAKWKKGAEFLLEIINSVDFCIYTIQSAGRALKMTKGEREKESINSHIRKCNFHMHEPRTAIHSIGKWKT